MRGTQPVPDGTVSGVPFSFSWGRLSDFFQLSRREQRERALSRSFVKRRTATARSNSLVLILTPGIDSALTGCATLVSRRNCRDG